MVAELLAPVRAVAWTPSFAALLLYVVIITTYRIGFGSLVIAVALLGLLLERGVRVSGMVVWMLALYAWAFMTQFGSHWPEAVRPELFEFGKVGLIVLVASTVLNTRARIRLFMLVSVAAFAMYPARGALFNYFLGGYSLLGRAIWNNIFANPNDMAAFTLLALSVAAAIYAAEPRGLFRWGAIASFVVLPFVIMLTQSRGGFLGMGIFALVVFTAHRKKARLVGLAGLVLVAALVLLPANAWERFGMLSTIGKGGTEVLGTLQDDGSAKQRYEIWQTAFRTIADQPIQGVGWGTYAVANAAYSPELGARDAHSTYIDIAASAGVPGLLLFVALIAATLRRSHTAYRRLLPVAPQAAQQVKFLTLGLIGFLAAAVFATYSSITLFYMHIALVWAVADTHLRELAPRRASARQPRRAAAPAPPLRF